MPRPLTRAHFFAPSPSGSSELGHPSQTEKANAVRWLFTCAERPRFELGDQKYRSQLSRLLHYHSATSPKKPPREHNGDANLVKSFHCDREKWKEFVSWLTVADWHT